MKTNNMSEIENSLLVTLRLLDPLKMLLQLVLKASQELAKAQRSCTDQLDGTPAQHLTDGALQKCKKIKEPQPPTVNVPVRTTSSQMKATLT
jgi:hypothetical protein